MIFTPKLIRFPLRVDPSGMYVFDADSEFIYEVRGWGHLSNQLGERAATREQSARAVWLTETLNALEAAGVVDPKAFIEEAVAMREAQDCTCSTCLPLSDEFCDFCAARAAFDRARGIK